ncbi:hypothetical protein K435DRAFT_680488 [Dendrothele bispora CBS 962.96]|uniref:GDP-fucose protein O-fucosyltransferase n=1 Tax=Dendrothele bispora (strain CBS 962.96) TaxID=1314807 RepID=A0A4S8LGX5_DENBC|nr:hypothetical protein K435DRAFT_680488 [Dendrothele bispora CBS 962.96]
MSKKFSSEFVRSPHVLLTKKYSRVLLGGLFFFSTLYFFLKIEDTTSSYSYEVFDPSLTYPRYPNSSTQLELKELPPLYEEWHEYERNLPQHDLTLPPPEGRAARFLFMANHAHASGWGNVLQEMIFNAHLAYATNRAFVFDNYTWDHHESDYSDFKGKVIPSRVPISTMLSGPIIGGPFDPTLSSLSTSSSSSLSSSSSSSSNSSSHHTYTHPTPPRAVSREYYRSICPSPLVIRSEETKGKISSHDGQTVMNGWVDRINELEDVRCVEFEKSSEQLFDIWLFGSSTVLSFWPTLRQSPIITQYAFSPLILSAFQTNKDIFYPPPSPPPASSPSFLESFLAVLDSPPLKGLLTVHIRRGDFEEHCRHLEIWNSEFSGFNSFPEMVDRLEDDEEDEDDSEDHNGDEEKGGEGEGEGAEEEERKKKMRRYQKHCYPEIGDVVRKINKVRKEARDRRYGYVSGELSRVYVMSNAPKEWLEELKKALEEEEEEEEDKWEAVYTSRDLELSWEQKYVAQTLDMYVAMRSQGFIGNGFSSLTSNIVMMRMARGFDPVYTRLW